MTKTLDASAQGDGDEIILNKGALKESRKHGRRHLGSLKLCIAAITIISVIGWILLRRMEMALTEHTPHAPTLIRPTVQAEETQHELNAPEKRFAYFFYVTSNIYACASIQFIDRLVNTLHWAAGGPVGKGPTKYALGTSSIPRGIKITSRC
ncbi:hypothetical protein DVH05_002302 [Phytophthora capsici]|nr:hypothetical protein DVH05_002302 [Phytophthora capsici]